MNNRRSKKILTIFLILVFCVSLPWISFATTMEEAVEKGFLGIKDAIEQNVSGERFLISVVNYHNQEHDELASEIETIIYFNLDKLFPRIKKVFLAESSAGVSSSGTMFINGTYKKSGDAVELHLQVFKGLQDGELIGQISETYGTESSRRKTLVAILDLEAKMLNLSQKKIYSEIFRSSLNNIGIFDIANSADVDKMNPDAIQKASGCTRDECATIIGEQLGVDRAISMTLIQRSDNRFFLTGKLIDIKDGSIVRSANVDHVGSVNDMDRSFQELAKKIADIKATKKLAPRSESGKQVLAVFKLQSASKISEETLALSERIREEILRHNQFSMIETAQMDEAMEQAGFQNTACGKFACAIEISQNLGADKAVIGDAHRILEKYWLVKASLIDVSSQTTLRTESVRYEGQYFELLDKGIEDLVAKLFEDIQTPETAPVAETPALISEPEPLEPEEPVEPVEPVEPALQDEGEVTEYSAFVFGLPNSYELKSATYKCTTCLNSVEEDWDIEPVGSPSGVLLHFYFPQEDDSVAVGLGFISVEQPFELVGGDDFGRSFKHDGIELDVGYSQQYGLRLGLGFGMYTTTINCTGCTSNQVYSADVGTSLGIKIGFQGDTFGFQFSSYTMYGNANYTYTNSKTFQQTDYDLTWEATMTSIAVVLLF